MISKLAKGTEITQTFWGCDDTNTGGVLGVLVDGELTTGDTLASADDYTGLVTVSGLSSGSHSYQMALDGVAVGNVYSFSTHPVENEEYDVLLIGDGVDPDQIADLVTNREAQARLVYGAEMSYIEGGYFAGEPTPASKAVLSTAGNPSVYQEYLDWYRAAYRTIWGRKRWHRFINSFAGRYIWDNHEFDSNAGDNGTGVRSSNGECQYDAAIKAYREYEGGGLPSASDDVYTVDSWPDPVVYFSEVVGDIEFICPDYTSYTPLPTGAQLGDAARAEQAQKAWLESVVAASTAKCIIIFLPSKAATDDGVQEWVDNATGLLRNGLQVGKPIFICSANVHVNFARGVYRTSGMARPIPELGISCFRQKSRGAVPFHVEDNPASSGWPNHQYTGNTDASYPVDYEDVHTGIDPEWVYGLVQRRSGYTRIQIKNVIDGHVRFEVTLNDDLTTEFSNRKRAV